jgi:hypothetical protein
MELKELCGEHLLSGVDFTKRSIVSYGTYEEECNVCRFRLDGVTYEAIEDPDDGYRSHMRDLGVSADPTTNEWAPVRVICSLAEKDEYGQESHLLELRDAVTGGVVLRVGAANTDDYYPYYVADFNPTALAHNAPGDA